MSISPERYFADKVTPYSNLKVKPFFDRLSPKEKRYAHHLSRAAFEGTRIIIRQINPKAILIYDLILSLFSDDGRLVDINQLYKDSGIKKESFDDFIQYCAMFLGNLSNYRSMGDEKFIPRISPQEFSRIAQTRARSSELFKQCAIELYQIEPEPHTRLGLPDEGHVSGHYQNVTIQEIEQVQAVLDERKQSSLNTLIQKRGDKIQVMIAAGQETIPISQEGSIEIVYRGHAKEMAKIAQQIESAIPFAANPTQEGMLEEYYLSYQTGSIEAHRDAQRLWLNDLNPTVETNSGFIETYRDPLGLRAEWEGFVAIVNEEGTGKFERLVRESGLFRACLPWSDRFEQDRIQTDFKSLEVLTYTTATMAAGVNLPNYRDIVKDLKSKNVALGNVMAAVSPDEVFAFIRQDDLALYRRYRHLAFEVQVGTHELGHGTGRSLGEADKGLVDPLTGQAISGWYRDGQGFHSVFKSVAASYEECRAECIALVTSAHPEILALFGYHGQEAEDVLYVMYLNMVHAGLTALECYNTDLKKWAQPHMQARYGLMRVMMAASEDFVTFVPCVVKGRETLEIHLDRSKIRSVGLPAISDFLLKLQIYKSTADSKHGIALYNEVTHVPEDWYELYEIVMESKQPRKIFVQANTFLHQGEVILKEYEPSAIGLIQSFVERRV